MINHILIVQQTLKKLQKIFSGNIFSMFFKYHPAPLPMGEGAVGCVYTHQHQNTVVIAKARKSHSNPIKYRLAIIRTATSLHRLGFCFTASSRLLCFAERKTVVRYFAVTANSARLRSTPFYTKTAACILMHELTNRRFFHFSISITAF